MKKILLIATILAQTITSSIAQEMPWFMRHQKEPSYKGPVKEIKEYHPLIVSEPELQDTSYYFCTYSIDKKLLSVYISDVDGTLNMKYYWSNHLDSIINYGEYNSIKYYIYDTNNRLEKIVINHLDHRFYDTVIYTTPPAILYQP